MNDVKVLDALPVQETEVNLIYILTDLISLFSGGYFIPRTRPVTYGMWERAYLLVLENQDITWRFDICWICRSTVRLYSLKQTAREPWTLANTQKEKESQTPFCTHFFEARPDMLVWGSVFTFGDESDSWRNRCVRFLRLDYRWYRCCSFKVFALYPDLIGKWPNLNQFDILYPPRTRKVSG